MRDAPQGISAPLEKGQQPKPVEQSTASNSAKKAHRFQRGCGRGQDRERKREGITTAARHEGSRQVLQLTWGVGYPDKVAGRAAGLAHGRPYGFTLLGIRPGP